MPTLFVNKTIINRGDSGFVFSFRTNEIADVQGEEVAASIGMSPQYAKMFLVHLYAEVSRFEAEYGEIKMSTGTIEDLRRIERQPIGFSR